MLRHSIQLCGLKIELDFQSTDINKMSPKAKLPLPVYAFVFQIAFRFTCNYIGWINQGK